MQDRELVAAIAAGDPEGLAETYDRYAVPLYAYCRFMLPDPDSLDGAAQAVQDTFIIATSRLQGLRDPDRLGFWLHAVARNECLRQLDAEGSRAAAALGARADPVDALPADGLREQILNVCADSTPTGRAHRVSVTHRAGPFDRTGFPKPIVPPGPAWWHEVRRHPGTAVAVAVVAGAVLAAGITALAVAGGSHRAQVSTVALGGGVSPVASSTAPGSTSAPVSPGHRIAAAKGTPTPSVLADTPTTSQGTAPGTPRPSAPAPSSSSRSSSPSRSPSPSPSPSPSSSPAQGHLVAAPTKLVLSAVKGKAASGTFTLTAVGGPVSAYAITSASSEVTVSPSYGALPSAGARVVITVTVKSLVALDTKITVQPGYLVVTVVFSIKV
jgi:hypothetical protein